MSLGNTVWHFCYMESQPTGGSVAWPLPAASTTSSPICCWWGEGGGGGEGSQVQTYSFSLFGRKIGQPENQVTPSPVRGEKLARTVPTSSQSSRGSVTVSSLAVLGNKSLLFLKRQFHEILHLILVSQIKSVLSVGLTIVLIINLRIS